MFARPKPEDTKMPVIDADQHLFELPDFWRSYCDAKKREGGPQRWRG